MGKQHQNKYRDGLRDRISPQDDQLAGLQAALQDIGEVGLRYLGISYIPDVSDYPDGNPREDFEGK
ncbi:MAG: hypothetical protein V4439_03005 [Patescibacteria group bacterium]